MAGRIPQSFINELIDRADIVDVIERRMTLKKTGKNYSGLCPFHDEKTPSFSVSPDKQFFHCFGCQESGTALGFVMKFERLEFPEAVETLARELGLEVPREQVRSERRVDPSIYDVLAKAERFYRSCLRDNETAIGYLKSRGLTGEVARDFGIGYAPEGWQVLKPGLANVTEKNLLDAGLAIKNEKGRVYDRFRDRVMFPIKDTRGRVIAFGGRTMRSEDGPKYLNSPETDVFHKSNELYGLYEARKALRQIDRLIVVEGYMDVVALAQFGIANAVATLGTATGTAHFNKLYRYTDEVVCCFDGDQAGRQAAWKALDNALPALNENRLLKFVFLEDGEDPDSLVRKLGMDAFNERIQKAQGALDFLLQRLSSGLDLDSFDGQVRLAGLAEPYIEKLPMGLLRDRVRERVGEITKGGLAPSRSNVSKNAQPARANGRSKVSERLLTILVKHPSFWHLVEQDLRQTFLKDGVEDLELRAFVQYLDANPETDTEELLIRFAQDEYWATMLPTLAGKSLEIDDVALKQELPELVQIAIKQAKDKKRKEALQNLKSSADPEAFKRYWSERE